MRYLSILMLAWLGALAAGELLAQPPQWHVVEAGAYPPLEKTFRSYSGWTGADGAASIPQSRGRTLWTFADTFIGKIENGSRTQMRLINNSVAWQSVEAGPGPLEFAWRKSASEPDALLKPADPNAWYWPGDGVFRDGKLFLLAKRVRRRAAGEPGFQFDWFGDDLLRIENPNSPPEEWKFQSYSLRPDAAAPQLSAGCFSSRQWLYVYGLFPAARLEKLNRPLAVARIDWSTIEQGAPKVEYLAADAAGQPTWSIEARNVVALFNDAAPEMTVTRLAGSSLLVATYTSLGLSRDIRLRFAEQPEGPWSEPLRAFHCPENQPGILLYGAKAHPEFSRRDHELIITYCSNAGDLSRHAADADIYFPRAIRVELAPK